MTYGAFTTRDLYAYQPYKRSRPPISQASFCLLLFGLCGFAALALLFSRPALAPAVVVSAPANSGGTTPRPMLRTATLAPSTTPRASGSTTTRTILSMAPAIPAIRHTGALYDPSYVAAQTPMSFAQNAALRAGLEQQHTAIIDSSVAQADKGSTAPESLPAASQMDVASLENAPVGEPTAIVRTDVDPTEATIADVPLPMPRPSRVSPVTTAPLLPSGARRVEAPAIPIVPPASAPAQPTFFQRLFGANDQPKTALAYAPAGGGGIAGFLSGRANDNYDAQTAIYDISAHTVYLPNGARLEAHSGLGSRLDDPRGVAERMRGATPPNVYDLSLREAPFHGVRALRLTPVGGGNTFGRGGLLAHTFMLGPRGDSNGCVVFRDYQAFLRAYESGSIRRLAVVVARKA